MVTKLLAVAEEVETLRSSAETSKVRPTTVSRFRRKHPAPKPVVLEGMLRRGEIANIIASPKVGKTFLSINLAYSIANGVPFLGMQTTQGNVLIIDCELQPETGAERYEAVSQKMGLDDGALDIFSLRDNTLRKQLKKNKTYPVDINNLDDALYIETDKYQLVILDALYRLLPKGTAENDNGAMTAVYNKLDELAGAWNSAIAVVHHSSKGFQGSKSISDMGAGAGAISRTTDTHIAIREHESPGLFVLDAITRSFAQPQSISVQYDWPVFSKVDVPAVVSKPNGKKAQSISADIDLFLSAVPLSESVQRCAIQEKLGWGNSKFNDVAKILIDKKLVRREKSKRSVWFVRADASSSDLSSAEFRPQNSHTSA